ncbi:MAG TPA: carbamoyltransferase C-terminal domain-containing protein [Candidatus Polarisedimenticolia bacterium]|nr:carbamoyltransferase C-terminal domain-containing protein [Candidatus Polarisedimenticolia bacterium]
MIVLGISALDKESTVAILRDGRLTFALSEERLTREKQQGGFPRLSLRAALDFEGLEPGQIDAVAYPFFSWDRESRLILGCLGSTAKTIPRELGAGPGAAFRHLYYATRWSGKAILDHLRLNRELLAGLAQLGLAGKLRRVEHHEAHVASAYYASGFDRALILTVDAYGSGLTTTVSLGEGGTLRRIHSVRFPHSLGMYYAQVTKALGFVPDRHEGKILGLAAYGKAGALKQEVLARFIQRDGTFESRCLFDRGFAAEVVARHPREQVAAAWQEVLEKVVGDYLKPYLRRYRADCVALAGGVVANVKLNQRIAQTEGVSRVFVYPAMNDSGTGAGAAMVLQAETGGMRPARLPDVFLGPPFTERDVESALAGRGLRARRMGNPAEEIGELLAQGKTVARCAGRMEYGPRALGNRSILFHARDPRANQWLNEKLKRTEFMPFAPATLAEEAPRCYRNLEVAADAARFMTITYDCTDFMKQNSPAAVHVDGTARPQLVDEVTNPTFHAILSAYHRKTGIPSVLNTSFNIHEEPIVCSPSDAVQTFLAGDLDTLAIEDLLVTRS